MFLFIIYNIPGNISSLYFRKKGDKYLQSCSFKRMFYNLILGFSRYLKNVHDIRQKLNKKQDVSLHLFLDFFSLHFTTTGERENDIFLW